MSVLRVEISEAEECVSRITLHSPGRILRSEFREPIPAEGCSGRTMNKGMEFDRSYTSPVRIRCGQTPSHERSLQVLVRSSGGVWGSKSDGKLEMVPKILLACGNPSV